VVVVRRGAMPSATSPGSPHTAPAAAAPAPAGVVSSDSAARNSASINSSYALAWRQVTGAGAATAPPAAILAALDSQSVVVPGTVAFGRVIAGVAIQLRDVRAGRDTVATVLEARRGIDSVTALPRAGFGHDGSIQPAAWA
jgi:hypothetical protein